MRVGVKLVSKWFFEVLDIELFDVEPNATLNR